MRRLVRAPALHFLLLGAALFALRRDAHHDALAVRAAPTPAAGGARVPDDELLYREAVARGLDRAQPAVRQRLARLARFVGAGPVEDEEALAREARRLGLDREDVVVRRHLVRTMRLALGALDPRDLPDDATLAAWLAAHADELREPERVRVTQVFLGTRRRGTTARDAAAALLARLRRERIPPERAPALGDPCLVDAHLGPASSAELARMLGTGFAAAAASAPAGRWTGPVRSAWGEHLVWVHERVPGAVPPLDAVRSRVLHAVLAERRQARLAAAMRRLRSEPPSRVASGPRG